MLIDCGTFQGSGEVERANAEPFGFDPAGIDALLLPSLLAWLGETPRRKVFLVHGEYDRGMSALREMLEQRGVACHLPGLNEPIRID